MWVWNLHLAIGAGLAATRALARDTRLEVRSGSAEAGIFVAGTRQVARRLVCRENSVVWVERAVEEDTVKMESVARECLLHDCWPVAAVVLAVSCSHCFGRCHCRLRQHPLS